MSNQTLTIKRDTILKRQLFQLSTSPKSAVALSATVGSDWLADKHYLGQTPKVRLPAPGQMAWVPVAKMSRGKLKAPTNVLIANKGGKLFEADMPILWCAVGDGEGEEFGQDESALVDYLYECRIEFGHWNKPATNFQSALGTTVYCYWGDEEGSVVKPLTKGEQQEIEEGLIRVMVQNNPSRLFIAAPTTGQAADGDVLHKVCLIDNEYEKESADYAYMADGFTEVATFTTLAGAKRRCAKLGCDKPEVV